MPFVSRGIDEIAATPIVERVALRQTELTQAEWVAFGFPNPSGVGKGGVSDCIADDCPVGNVSWLDMLAYANRLSELHGFKPCSRSAPLRLLTSSIARQ